MLTQQNLEIALAKQNVQSFHPGRSLKINQLPDPLNQEEKRKLQIRSNPASDDFPRISYLEFTPSTNSSISTQQTGIKPHANVETNTAIKENRAEQ